MAVTRPTGPLAVWLPCVEELAPPWPRAAELLESALATAVATQAPPIKRPAASTQAPAAKRRCDGTIICPPAKEPLLIKRLPHSGIVRSSGTGPIKPNRRASVGSKPFLRSGHIKPSGDSSRMTRAWRLHVEPRGKSLNSPPSGGLRLSTTMAGEVSLWTPRCARPVIPEPQITAFEDGRHARCGTEPAGWPR
jgi:hypothetical protein